MNKIQGLTWSTATAVAAATLLAGCGPAQGPTAAPSPPPTTPSVAVSTPTFSPEQADATAAATGYVQTMGKIARFEPGVDPNEMHTYARAEGFTLAVKYFNDLAGRGLKEQGESLILTSSPSDVSEQDGRATVVVSMCIDERSLQIVNESGSDVMGSESKKVASTDFTVQQWAENGWFVTKRTEGSGRCDS